MQQTEPQISDYVSDGEDLGHSVTMSSSLASGSSPPRPGEGCQRRASDWVRSAQVLLRTPRRAAETQSKTPEDSGKKKRKFKRSFFTVQACFFGGGDVKNNKSMLATLTLGGRGVPGASGEMFPWQKFCQKGHLAGHVGAKGRQFQALRI